MDFFNPHAYITLLLHFNAEFLKSVFQHTLPYTPPLIKKSGRHSGLDENPNPLQARDERFAQLIVTANHHITDFDSTSKHNTLIIFPLLQINRNSSQHAEFCTSSKQSWIIKIGGNSPLFFTSYPDTDYPNFLNQTPWSIQPQSQQQEIRSNLLLDTHCR